MHIGLPWEYTTPRADKFGSVGYRDGTVTEPVTGGQGLLAFTTDCGFAP
jgi:hypothetical protein